MIHYPGHANTVDQAAGRLAEPQLAATPPQYRNAAAATAGDMFLATIRQSVYSRSLPLATRDLQIVRSSNIETIGLQGAAFVVLDELFSPCHLGKWINEGSPAGRLDLSRPA